MIRVNLFVTIVLSLSCLQANAESLNEIQEFARKICDDINPNGSISRQDIEAKLKGKLNATVKLFGAEITSDGTIKFGEESWVGLPYASLPAQMQDSRSCKMVMSTMLLRERKKK